MRRAALLVAMALALSTMVACDEEGDGEGGSGGVAGGGSGPGGLDGIGGGPGGSGGLGGSPGGSGGTAGGSGGGGDGGGGGGTGGSGGGPTCDDPEAIALPSSASYPLPAGGIICLSVDLQAEVALEVRLTSTGGVTGWLRLRTSGGEILAEKQFGVRVGAGRLFVGVAQAGTYRIDVESTGTKAVSVTASVAIVPAVVMGVPDSVPLNITNGTPQFVLVKPSPPGSTFAFTFGQATGVGSSEVGMDIEPLGAVLKTVNTQVRALAHRAHPLVLPAVEAFRNTGSATDTVTLATIVPETIPFNTDVSLLTSAADRLPLVRVFEGVQGSLWSAGMSYDIASRASPNVRVYTPSGAPADNNQVSPLVHSMPEIGPYTVEVVDPGGPPGSPFTLRLNDVPPPTPITPTAHTDLDGSLVLGEVKRYSFDLTQAQLLRFVLRTPTMLDIVALITGGDIYDGYIKLEAGPAPRGGGSLVKFVQETSPAILSVYSSGRYDGRSSGDYELELQVPTPEPASVGTSISGTLAKDEMRAYALGELEAGRYALTWSYSGQVGPGTLSFLPMDVWGPDEPFDNYDRGEINTLSSFFTTSGEVIGLLHAGANTMSVFNRLPDVRDFTALLTRIDDPPDLTVGAAPTAGTLEAGERDYFRFTGNQGEPYTVQIDADFAGELRIFRQPPNGDFTARSLVLMEFPQPFLAGAEKSMSFTIPAGGTGTYVVDIDAAGDVGGSYTVAVEVVPP